MGSNRGETRIWQLGSYSDVGPPLRSPVGPQGLIRAVWPPGGLLGSFSRLSHKQAQS